MGYGSGLESLINNTLDDGERLVVVQVSEGGTGWSNNRWSAHGDLWQELVGKVRYIQSIANVEFIGMFWSQGETDSLAPFSNIYEGLLDTLAITMREVVGNMNMPFITFQMLDSWVGNDINRWLVQTALADVGQRIPFAASINNNNLPGSALDTIHYSAEQQAELSHRFMSAWSFAQTSTVSYPSPPTSSVLIIANTGTDRFVNRWDAVKQGVETDPVFSRLNELWKYRNSDGKYHFLLRYTWNDGTTREYEFIQDYSPLSFIAPDMPVENIRLTGPLGNTIDGSIPSGIGFNSNPSDNLDAIQSLVTAHYSTQWWAPVGQSQHYRNAAIPVFQGDDHPATSMELFIVA